MPTYTYKAKKGPSESVQGEIDAVSQDEAVVKLEKMGLIPVSVASKGAATKDDLNSVSFPRKRESKPWIPASAGMTGESSTAPRSELSFFTRIRMQDIDTFTRQLSSLIRASVSVVGSLSLIAEQTQSKALKEVVIDLEHQVKEGKLLSEAMESHDTIFNNLYLSLVKAGERGGVLEETLKRLADHREKEDEVRRKIQAALAYPILMIVVGIGTIFVMLTYFLPKLAVLFENMRQTLPLPTRILMSVSNFTSANWYWILLAVITALAIFTRTKHGSKRKAFFDTVRLHTPFIKKFVMDTEIAKFTKTLGLLLKSGIPIHESLELATKTLDNEILRDKLKGVSYEIISQGSTLSGSLKKVDIFPPFATNMIAVGEEGGKLEGSLDEISLSYEKEVDQALKISTALIEPLLILVVGAVVGFIVFAMLLPIFNIGIMGR